MDYLGNKELLKNYKIGFLCSRKVPANVILKTYDWAIEQRDNGICIYQDLYDELKKFNSIRILESLWCFKRYNTSSSNLRDHFKSFIDNNDGLIVAEISDWASSGAIGTPNNLA